MAFEKDQIAALQAPLARDVVKEREQAGRKFSYVEAYHCENEANRIFGFAAWDRETDIALISEAVAGDKHRVYYRAKVRITVRSVDEVTVREGCGYGSGIDKDLGQAHESALKEAESDAEKRALKTFGNPFGQALYDKTKSEVAAPMPGAVDLAIRILRDTKSGPEFKEVWEKNYEGWKAVMDPADYAKVQAVKAEMVKKFTPATANEAA